MMGHKQTTSELKDLMKPRVLHVITELGAGGAERMLYRLVTASTKYHHTVIPLTGGGYVSAELQAAGVDVFPLHMSRYLPPPGALFRLARIIQRERPFALQTWLYHADLVGLLAARLVNFHAVAWNIRCSNMELSQYRWSTRVVSKLLIRLSSWPEIVIVNSQAGRRWHSDLGYRPKRWELVPNGIDTIAFRPDADARASWRRRLGVSASEILIGMVARRDPMKDHECMLQAAAAAARQLQNLAFVFAGRDVTRKDPVLRQFADAIGAPVHLIDECDDIAGLNAGLDIAALSSAFGEGYPNVIGEAMATGVPCIATDVGDAASIIGSTGLIVPPCSPEALADAITRLAADPPLRLQLGHAARHRIEQYYSLSVAVERYEALWQDLGATSNTRVRS